MDQKYPTKKHQELFAAILTLKSEKEASQFFRDLLTPAELKEFANRWQVIKLYLKGKSYKKIAEELKVSTTTVTRCVQWYKNGMGGYKLVAKKLFKK